MITVKIPISSYVAVFNLNKFSETQLHTPLSSETELKVKTIKLKQ